MWNGIDFVSLFVTNIVTIVTALFAIWWPIRKIYTKERDNERVMPKVSILDDAINDIQNRLEKSEYGCFFKLDELEKYSNGNYFYYVIRIDSAVSVSDAKVLFAISSGKDKLSSQEYKIGDLGCKQKLLIPIGKLNGSQQIDVVIEYRTNHNEYMRYELVTFQENEKLNPTRKESFYSLKHPNKFKFEDSIKPKHDNIKKLSKKIILHQKEIYITDNYNSNEVYARLTKKNISLNKSRIYDKEKNDEKE